MSRIAITGSQGFVGRNLCLFLAHCPEHTVLEITRHTDLNAFFAKNDVDVIVHLAGVNRDPDLNAFGDNARYLREVLDAAGRSGRVPPVIFSSSIQAALDNAYGRSKRAAEIVLEEACGEGAGAIVLRLPNIYGKFARREYNSVVATFCSQLVNGEELSVHNAGSIVRLFHIDDLCRRVLELIEVLPGPREYRLLEIEDYDEISVGDLAEALTKLAADIANNYGTALTDPLLQKLRATLASYYPPNHSLPLVVHEDARGAFFEVMRTDAGQFSVLTCNPGEVRGMHFHHQKFESFLVLHGEAEFISWTPDGHAHTLRVLASDHRVVSTQPGLVHVIRNIGDQKLIVWLWANENFDPQKPDTYATRMPLP